MPTKFDRNFYIKKDSFIKLPSGIVILWLEIGDMVNSQEIQEKFKKEIQKRKWTKKESVESKERKKERRNEQKKDWNSERIKDRKNENIAFVYIVLNLQLYSFFFKQLNIFSAFYLSVHTYIYI